MTNLPPGYSFKADDKQFVRYEDRPVIEYRIRQVLNPNANRFGNNFQYIIEIREDGEWKEDGQRRFRYVDCWSHLNRKYRNHGYQTKEITD